MEVRVVDADIGASDEQPLLDERVGRVGVADFPQYSRRVENYVPQIDGERGKAFEFG